MALKRINKVCVSFTVVQTNLQPVALALPDVADGLCRAGLKLY